MSSKNRIFKNTSFLYIRQLLTLGISLYVSRLTLHILGETDLGIYSAIAGFTLILNFLTNSLSTSGQRFLTFQIGKSDTNEAKRIFNAFFLAMVALSILFLIFAETIGLWLLYNILTIPAERIDVAFWVFQISILSCIINITSSPYNAVIIAHENMRIFAFFSILDALLKLGFVSLLFYIQWDKLILYSISLFIIQLILRITIFLYSRKKYGEVRHSLNWERKIVGEIGRFAGWNTLSSLSLIGITQGINILINIWFGPAVNAAYSVANQAYSGIRSFCSSFQLATNPQIIKTYSENKIKEMNQLLLFACKISFYLFFILSVPFWLNATEIMHLWLKDVPSYTTDFFRLLILYAYIDLFLYPLDIAMQATGKIRNYTLATATLHLTILPIGYLVYKSGGSPASIYIVAIVVNLIGIVLRVQLLKQIISINSKHFYLNLLRCACVAGGVFFLTLFIQPYFEDTSCELWSSGAISIIISCICIYWLGLRQNEKIKVQKTLRTLFTKLY